VAPERAVLPLSVDSLPAYDELPYAGRAYWFTHPDHLSVLGRLHGLASARAEGCRVLELGCGDGVNLLSMATGLPDSRFVGVDLGAVHVARGVRRVGELAVANVELLHADIRELGASLGTFDYIIAHGIFSWVSEEVRVALLDVLDRALAPHGVALVSFNAYPGWHDVAPVRRLMRFHTEPVAEGAAKLARAREVARWYLARRARLDEEVLGELMVRLHTRIHHASDAILRHDYLSEHHTCFYFEDFMALAAARGMDFMTNARPGRLRASSFEPEIAEMLRAVPDVVRQQQYIDFLAHTRFREVLLCRREREVMRAADLDTFRGLSVEARTASDPWGLETRGEDAIRMETRQGFVDLIGRPLRIVLSILHHRIPEAVPMEELLAIALPELAAQGEDGGLAATAEGRAQLEASIVRELAELYFKELVRLWREPPRLAPQVDERPRTGGLQRMLAAEGPIVPTLSHRDETRSDLERDVLQRCDGSTTRARLRDELGDGVDEALENLRRLGYLMAAPGPALHRLM